VRHVVPFQEDISEAVFAEEVEEGAGEAVGVPRLDDIGEILQRQLEKLRRARAVLDNVSSA
jgi:hypothetical protein